ncbi:MAG: carbamoyltransferase HypF [Coriobacteriales bacterium]|nr:carbamoyltransferase HypF [Coriobacteriales bacterium]
MGVADKRPTHGACAQHVHMSGIVQGVGFRPFVYNLARELGLAGWVNNASDGVHVHVQGDASAVERFIATLPQRAPVMSRIESLHTCEAAFDPSLVDFEIRLSDASTSVDTLVSPDIATCDDCLRELFDPADRRFRYPFINCTQCGPRFTIIRELPYDRPATSMRDFTMCPACEREYHDPGNRRFHAQPDACFDCGPRLLYWDKDCPQGQASLMGAGMGGSTERSSSGGPHPESPTMRDASEHALAAAVRDLRAGRIVAIKGLGGFHLACDARNQEAVQLLRNRKHRPMKPFAVMMGDITDVRRYCYVSDTEEALLGGTVRPIVLLRRRHDAAAACLAPGVAGDLDELGVMLPYTPLQHLLLHDFAGPLVMTSGNLSEEPILASDGEAKQLLGGIADSFLSNDRPILSRYDDSVVRVQGSRVLPIRRARGLAPAPLPLPVSIQAGLSGQGPLARISLEPLPLRPTKHVVLACGPEQKNTFCLASPGQGRAFVSQHLGDLENQLTYDAWLETIALYQRLFQLEPNMLVCDMHPEYLSTKWAQQQASAHDLPLEQVQHHHAHIVAVAAEHDVSEPVLGLALDGTGYGDDGHIWGGELLLADWCGYERLAHLEYLPLPGGAAAIKNPCRMAWGMLLHYGLQDHPGAAILRDAMSDTERSVVSSLVARRINTPLTSSAGRLLDAVSALLGVCSRASYDGEPAIRLEAAMYASRSSAGQGQGPLARISLEPLPLPNELEATPVSNEGGLAVVAAPYRFDVADDVVSARPAIEAVLDDIAAGVPAGLISKRFHEDFARVWVDVVTQAAAASKHTVAALGGGVFMNRYLLSAIKDGLEAAGLTVLLGKELPCNDGCISYGQAVVALARAQGRNSTCV